MQDDRSQWDLMHRRVYRISIALQAAWILAAIPTSAADRSAGDKHADRWIPSWALVFGFTGSGQDIDNFARPY